MIDDIYASETQSREHHLQYLRVEVNNVTGILNRISSLMRRKRYNIEELSISFRDTDIAYILIAIDGRSHDIMHVAKQLARLFDVISVQNVSHLQPELCFALHVSCEDAAHCALLPYQPTLCLGTKHLYILQHQTAVEMMQLLRERNIPFVHEVLGIE